jgi:hypothetical protein
MSQSKKDSLPAPPGLFISFVKQRILNSLSDDSEQDLDELYKTVTSDKEGYEKYDWASVKGKILDSVEEIALNIKASEKPRKAEGKKKWLKKGKPAPKEEAKAEAEEGFQEPEGGTSRPKKIKTKRGTTTSLSDDGLSYIVEGQPDKVGVKCAKGEKAFENVISPTKRAYGCRRKKTDKLD